MAVPLHDNTDAVKPFDINERQRVEDTQRRPAERQALLLQVTSDLIRASEPGELARVTFEHISSAFGADICFNYRLDPAGPHLKLVFGQGIPPEYMDAAQSLEVGQEFCGAAAGGCEAVIADKKRIACDPKGAFMRLLGTMAYACHPLMASNGRVLGTFAIASTTREGFADDEVTWLGTVTNFLAQAWERFEAEQDLRVSEERLRRSQEAASLGHWDFDFAGTLVWSEQTRKLLGVEATTPASKRLLLSLVHPEDRARLEEHVARSVRPDTDHRRRLEFRIVTRDGTVRWLEDQSQVETDAVGMPVRAVGIVRDITAHKSAEELQARLAAIVASSADAIVGQTLDDVVTCWNEAAECMFGYSANEMIGQSIRCVVPADRQPEEDMILARLARSECIESYETLLLAKEGRTFDASVTVSPIRDAEGHIIGCSKIIRDITERKRMESRLAEHEAQLALFVDHAPAAIAMFDANMRYLAVSRRYISDFRLPITAELIGRSHYEVFPDIPPRWREVHARVLAGEELAQEEDSFPRRDGTTHWVRWSMKPWRTSDGRIGGALLFSEMITGQVEARRAHAESEARFRATFENAAVGIAHLGPDLRWLRANEALCRILGYPLDELVTKSLQDITHPDDLAANLALVERMRAGMIDSYDMDKRYLRKDGSIIWGRLTVGRVRKSDGSNEFVSVLEDITGRKHAEEELRKSEERFRSSLIHSPLPILMFDDREQILAVSQSWLEGSGYSKEELRRIEDWATRAYGARSGNVLEQIRKIIRTEPEARASEGMIRTKDGRERLWSVVVSALGTQSDGRRLFVCMAQDVTEQKAHEEHVQLLMREVNHRAKNMLSVVVSIAHQTAAQNPKDFVERFSDRIQALSANQDLLVRNEWNGVDIEDLVRAQLAHFADLIGSRIVIQGAELRLNAASAQAIGLALHELATNAGKYGALSTDRGRVDISWETEVDTLAMSWVEHDGPPVVAPKRRGFGTTVMEAMAERSVDGVVDLDYAPSGVTWRLTCPAANVLEPSGT